MLTCIDVFRWNDKRMDISSILGAIPNFRVHVCGVLPLGEDVTR